jgi:hypothetical protein
VGVLLAVGVVYALIAGKGMQKSVAYSFFVGGIVTMIFGGLSGGGGMSQRASGYRGGTAAPAETPFGTVLIGAIVFALGLGVVNL